jgi:predicted HAD superfamily phosphohydrolase YqeG
MTTRQRRKTVIYVDVDDTLVRTVGTKRIPMSGVVEHVRGLHADGAQLYCWSSGGAEYAEEVARELKIEACFRAFLPKPDVIIDDQGFESWRYLIQAHPNDCASRSLAEYQRALEP